MTTHKGHFRWFNDELVYGKQQWTRVYFVLHMEERALYIYKEKKDQSKEWKKIDVSKGSCVNGRQKSKKHVFVFTANNTKEYVFRSEHKNKKKQWVRYLNDAAKAAPKEEPKPAAAAEKKPEEAPKKKDEEEEGSSSSDESSSSDSDSSSSDEEDEAAAAAAAAKKKAEEEAAAAAAAKKKADDEAAAAAAEAERKKKEADEAAAAAAAAKKKADDEEAERKKKEAEKEAEEESSSSDDDSSSSDSSSSDGSESEASEAPAPAPAAAPQPASADVPKNAEVHNTYPRLLQLQGKKKTEITITHVPATGASVNDSDVFILDCDKTVYTWLGASPNMWQKQAAATLTRAMDDERGSSVNNLVISNASSSDAAKFWELLGGKPEQLSKSAPVEAQLPVLFRLSDASGKMEFAEVGRGNPLKRSLLDSDDVFIADLGFHVFVWIGKKASRDERDKAVGYALDYKQKYNRPAHIHVERVMDGGENEILYSFFQ